MTSIAVTASICANASEAALLVASFMSISLDLGAIHRCAPRRATTIHSVTRNTPRRRFALCLSPHSGEYRRSQGRTVLRRQFDSLVLLWSRPPDIVSTERAERKSEKPKENHGPHPLQPPRQAQRAHARTARQEPQRQHLPHDGAFAELP